MTDDDWDAGHARSHRRVPQRRGDPAPGPAGRARSSTTRSCCCSTPRHEPRRRSRSPAAWGDALGASCSTRQPSRPRRASDEAGVEASVVLTDRSVVLAAAARARRAADGYATPAVTGAPLATYRLQLHPGLRLRRRRRGRRLPRRPRRVATSTCSPYLQAAPGSTHGYDVVDHARLSDELGGDGGPRPARAPRSATHGLGQVLDIVPNHMAITGPRTAGGGTCSRTGRRQPCAGALRRRLGPARGEAAQHGAAADPRRPLRPRARRGRAHARARRRPRSRSATSTTCSRWRPASLDGLLAAAAARAGDPTTSAFVADAPTAACPPATRTDRPSVAERHRDTEVLRAPARPAARRASPTVARRARRRGRRRSTPTSTRLDALLERPELPPRPLAHRRARARLPPLLRHQHARRPAGRGPRRLRRHPRAGPAAGSRDGVVDGLRVDHLDGLRDPEQYLERLRAAATGGAWLVVEKILEPGEELPDVVAGRRHDRLRLRSTVVGGLFVDPAGEEPLTAGYGALTGDDHRLSPTVAARGQARWCCDDVAGRRRRPAHRAARRRVRGTAATTATTPATRCTRPLARAARRRSPCTAPTCGPTAGAVRRDGRRRRSPRPSAAVAERRPDLDPDLLDVPRRPAAPAAARRTAPRPSCAMRFQQLTGPAMAKGVEDTAFYRYTRLLAAQRGRRRPGAGSASPVDAFHAANARGARAAGPTTMTTLSTHDTKRSADVRARLALLSEIPERVGGGRRRWIERVRAGTGRGGDARPAHAEYLLFQTLVGRVAARRRPGRAPTWRRPPREAKLRTSWTEPDAAFDAAVDAFVRGRARRRRARSPTSPRSSARAGRAGSGHRAGPGAAAAHGARRARRLPGHRAVGPQPRRPRQPPAGRLRRCAGRCWPRCATRPRRLTRRARRRRRAGLPKLRRGARGAAPAPPAARRRSAPGRRAPTRRWRSPAPRPATSSAVRPAAAELAVAVVVPGWCSAWRRPAGGATRPSALPPGRWTRRGHGATGEVAASDGAGARVPLADAPRRAVPSPCWSARPCRARTTSVNVSVWAPRAARSVERRRSAATAASPTDARGDRAAGGPATCPALGPGDDYALLARRRPPRARPPLGATSPTASTARRGVVDHAAFPWTDAGWRGRRPARRGPLRAARRHVLAPRAPSTAPSTASTTSSTSASTPSSCCPSPSSPARRGWGYDGVDLCAPHHAYGGPDGLKRLVDACHAPGPRRRARRRLQPPRPDGEPPRRFGPYFTDRHHTPGARPSTSTARAATRCGASSSTTPASGCATTTSTGCGSTPCTPSSTTRHATSSSELADEVRGAGRRARPAAVADRRERPATTPAFVRPAERGRLRPRRRVGRRPGTTPSTPSLTGERDGYYEDFGSLAQLAKALRQAWVLRRHLLAAPRPRATAARRRACPATGSSCPPRTTTRSATGPRGDRLGAPRVARAGCGSPPPCC